MPRRALAASLCSAVALLVLATPAAPGARGASPRSQSSGGDLERKRDEAKRRQGQLRQQLDLATASEAELNRRLEEIDNDLARRRSEAEAARADSEEAAASVTRITGEIDALRARLTQRRGAFNRRAVIAYMGGHGRPLDNLAIAGELLSLPTDFADAARRAELVSRVAAQDGDALGELTQTQSDLSSQERALVKARSRAVKRAGDATAAVEAVAQLKKEQEVAQAALQRRITDLQGEFDALAAEQARLETLIQERLAAAARARAARGNPFVGRLPGTGVGISAAGFIWPVQGVITSGFGPRWGRMHTGIDIAAPAGTPIHTAKAGEVIYADWLGGYGNLVVVDHGDSVVTLYAHQSRIGVAEGQVLNQGDVLGFVGSTGHSTGNHLHFEVRIDTQPRNPRPYLP
jgi:murein DD-endopeptidase MepM/ murein hydrolase activator NlpD